MKTGSNTRSARGQRGGELPQHDAQRQPFYRGSDVPVQECALSYDAGCREMLKKTIKSNSYS